MRKLVLSVAAAMLFACRVPPDPAPAPKLSAGKYRLASPDAGPTPFLSPCILPGPFQLIANYDFGTAPPANIADNDAMVSAGLFYHDTFNTIANGVNYGAVVVAPTPALAIAVSPLLNQPGNLQPVEDPNNPTRVFTANTMIMNVRELFDASTCTPAQHNAGCGSFYANHLIDAGGTFLGRDIVWEVRIRYVNPPLYYWASTWTEGNIWNHGAEVDTPETFGAATSYPDAAVFFHVNSVGGIDRISYTSFQAGMATAGIPTAPSSQLDLTQFHIWTFVYKRDNTYFDYVDTYRAQDGTICWTADAGCASQSIDMSFQHDCTWGNVANASTNPDTGVPVANVRWACEIDYSRIWLQ